MKASKSWLVSVFAVALGSCGGDSAAPQATHSVGSEITHYGGVWLDSETWDGQATQTYAFASFARSAEPIDPRFFELINILSRGPQTEGCTLENQESDAVANGDEQALIEELFALAPDEDSLETIGAGEFVSIITPEGSWPALFQDSTGYGDYQTGRNEYQPGVIGLGSTVTFSGGDFPAMSDVALATVAPILDLAMSASSADLLKAGDSVTWKNNSNRPNDYAALDVYVHSLEVTDNGHSYTGGQRLRCTVADTGRFTLPPELNTLVSNQAKVVSAMTLTRTNLATYRQGNALLTLSATSEAEITAFE